VEPDNLKYHDTLANYFHAKSLPFAPLSWHKCSNRTLTELPFQILHSKQTQRVYNELCNPLFIEASIKGGLLNNVIGDLNFSVSQANLTNIIPIRNSILNGITAIRARPSLSVYTILNRLIHADIDEVIKEFLLLTQQKLDADGVWLCTQIRLPNTQQIKGIVGINITKNSLYVIKDKTYIEILDLETHFSKGFHRLNTKNEYFEVAIHSLTESIAVLDNQGNLTINSNLTGFRLKPQSCCFRWFDDGIIGINTQGLLVFIDLIKKTENVLWELPILPYSSVTVSQELNTAIVVSGDRPNYQHILLLQTMEGYPKCSEIKFNDLLVNSAYLDQTGSYFILSTSSRELWLFNANSKESINISYRLSSGLPVRGKINKGILSTQKNYQIAVLATTDGELLIWDTSKSSLQRRGTFKGLGQDISIQAMDIMPLTDKLVIATSDTIETLNIPGEELLVSKSPVTHCCFSNDDWFITVNEQARKVTWFKGEKYITDFIIPNYQPVSITSFGEQGSVVVGYKNGTVAKLQPGIQPVTDDCIDLFDGYPIISVINWGDKNILAACKNGQFKITNFEPVPNVREIKPAGFIREELITCKLGKSNDILTCGRSHSGDSSWSLIVIRENDSREVVFETKEIVTGLAASNDGNYIFSIIGGDVYCYTRRIRNRWDLFSMREANADQIAICHNDLLAVVSNEKGMNWLELWNNAIEMKTVAAMELPFHTTCIYSLFNSIGIGTEDGNYCIIKIRNNT